MTGQFEGKVAFITGAARGQGRSHAVRFAEEGADIIAVDLCEQLDTVAYPMATPADLAETAEFVEKTGRRIVAEQADVRDLEQLKSVVTRGVAELGRVDFVLANAGIAPFLAGKPPMDVAAYLQTVDVVLNGAYFAIEAALPAMLKHGDGGAIVITGSGGGRRSIISSFHTMSPGAAGYTAGKHGIVGLMHYYATALGEKNIRVNVVHPGATETPMLYNEQADEFMAAFPEHQGYLQNRIPLATQPADITAAMLYLCGESGRLVSGVEIAVDGAGTV